MKHSTDFHTWRLVLLVQCNVFWGSAGASLSRENKPDDVIKVISAWVELLQTEGAEFQKLDIYHSRRV